MRLCGNDVVFEKEDYDVIIRVLSDAYGRKNGVHEFTVDTNLLKRDVKRLLRCLSVCKTINSEKITNLLQLCLRTLVKKYSIYTIVR